MAAPAAAVGAVKESLFGPFCRRQVPKTFMAQNGFDDSPTAPVVAAPMRVGGPTKGACGAQ
jgi:hypothetical protein